MATTKVHTPEYCNYFWRFDTDKQNSIDVRAHNCINGNPHGKSVMMAWISTAEPDEVRGIIAALENYLATSTQAEPENNCKIIFHQFR